MDTYKETQKEILDRINHPQINADIERALTPALMGIIEENELRIFSEQKDDKWNESLEQIENLYDKIKEAKTITQEDIRFYSKCLSVKDGEIINPNKVAITLPKFYGRNSSLKNDKLNIIIFYDESIENLYEISDVIGSFNDSYFIKNTKPYEHYLHAPEILNNIDFFSTLTGVCFDPFKTVFLHIYKKDGSLEVDRLVKMWFEHHFYWENLKNWKGDFEVNHILYTYLQKAFEDRNDLYVLEDHVGLIDQGTGERIVIYSEINENEKIPFKVIYDGTC